MDVKEVFMNDHITYYENKAMSELEQFKFNQAAKSYESAAQICQSLEDLENAQKLFRKSAKMLGTTDPQQSQAMLQKAEELGKLTGHIVSSSSNSDDDDEGGEDMTNRSSNCDSCFETDRCCWI